MAQLKDMGRIFVLICGMTFIVMGITIIIESAFYGKITTTINLLFTLLAVLIIPGIIIVRYVFRKEAEATTRQLRQQIQIQQQKVQDYTAPPYEATGVFKGFFKRKTRDDYTSPAMPASRGQMVQASPLVGARSTLDIPDVKVLFFIFILAMIIGELSLSYSVGEFSLYKGVTLSLTSFIFPISFIIAFTFPSLMWISYIYHKDIYEPEPRRAILTILAWGMFSVVPAIFLEILVYPLLPAIKNFSYIVYGSIFVFSIPVIEEFCKIVGVPKVKKEIDGELDGIIYGITAGMGFAMVENMMYELGFLFGPKTGIVSPWTMGALLRGISSTAIHAVCSGLIGYGYARYLYKEPKSIAPLISMYMVAVIIHGGWNGSLIAFDRLNNEWVWVFIAAFPLFVFLILRHYVTKGVDSDRERYKVPYTMSSPSPQPPPPPPQPQTEQQHSPSPFDFQREEL
jgi:RsiW-degrading membrane proteinase PrsW (M82 family)